MERPADPGYRDLDHSTGFDEMVRILDHFNDASYIKAARRELYRLLRPQRGARILDAGCGPGFDVAALAPRVLPGGVVVGLDLSRRMIDLARERYGHLEGVDFQAGSIGRIDYPDAYFDAAFAMRTVQYLDDPLVAVRELARVTRPGGRVVLVEGGMAAVDLPDSELTRFVFGHGGGASIGARLPSLLRQAGLTRITVRPGFGVELGRPDPQVLEYARSMAQNAVAEGVATDADATAWLRDIDSRVASGAWFAADSLFVVAGTVPRRRD